MTQTEIVLLELVKCGLGLQTPQLPEFSIDWDKLFELSARQGVLCICLDAIAHMPIDKKPPKDILMKWIGTVLHSERLYEHHKNLLRSLCTNLKGVHVLLLKGIGLSGYYPIPKHRPTGDIDIISYGQHKRIDSYFEQIGYKPIQTIEKHTIVTIDQVIIENHSIYVDAYATKAENHLQAYLETMCDDKLQEDGYYVPSPIKNYLFLLSHTIRHFSEYQSITLRHILDWGLFLKGENEEIMRQWTLIKEKLNEFGLSRCNDLFTDIAQDFVRFDLSSFIISEVSKVEKDKILSDILKYKEVVEHNRIFPRIWHKCRRLYANRWKFDYLPFSFWERIRFSVLLHWKHVEKI